VALAQLLHEEFTVISVATPSLGQPHFDHFEDLGTSSAEVLVVCVTL
jgi:hypothetical protein